MADNSLQTIRDYASSLQGDDRKNFIDKFNSIKDDDSKVTTLVGRIGKISNSTPTSSDTPQKQQDPLSGIPAPLKAAIQFAGGMTNTMTGGAMGKFEDWMQQKTGIPRPSDPNSMSYGVGSMAGYIPVGMGAEAGMSALAGKAAPQMLQKTLPMMAAKGALEGAATGAYGTPDNRLGGAIAGGIGGAVTAPIGAKLAIPKNLDDNIVSTYSQAINPSLGKIVNPAKLSEFQGKTVDAMKAIGANADNIKFENPNTGAMESRLPQSRVELLDALQQTKQSIYGKYNALQKSATDAGAKVDVPAIANEALNNIKNNRQYKLYAPEIVKDAQQVFTRLAKEGQATPEEVQKDLAFLNQKMKGFYQKGDYNAANIYADYAGSLRNKLDSSIETALEKGGYQDLKNKYASLKYVESDLSKAAARQLKSAQPGLGENFSNPIALAEMARGIFTSSPAEFATGATIKGVSTIHKMLNSPDWRIKNMFQAISKQKGK